MLRSTLRTACLAVALGLPLACASAPAPSISTTIVAGSEAEAPPKNYIVGYGSLMEDASRERTVKSARYAYPVIVEGFERGWFAQGGRGNFGITYLGAVAEPNAKIWAVIYDVSESDLAATDAREGLYVRAEVRRDQLRMFKGMSIADDAKIWIYLAPDPSSVRTPDAAHPIVQSYVDVFINGCLELQDRYQIADFAVHCLSTTTGWSAHWVNDRIYPRRPFVHEPNAMTIDALLAGDPRTGEYFLGATRE